ncbi:netrin receptor UNC5C-like [Brachionus plicatilis]|uniref:Netrin receptor UNC5 n=1 Tax=Brachionus plicatilis TaxID=10195 RepID=A0A3M7SPY1_BRAPC|nr:netrin receptor UNC5C-like [Brachionus plicatilis]
MNIKKLNNLIPPSRVQKEFPYSAIAFLILSISGVILLVVIISFLTLRKKQASMDNCKTSEIDHHPIYFSIQPDYNQDHFMESLLPLKFNNQPNSNMLAYDLNKNYHVSTYLAANYDETVSGSNSTASSKVKLSSSPTDSLAKNSLYLLNENSVHSYSLCSAKKAPRSDHDDKSAQILKLISEHKSAIYTAKNVKFDDQSSNEFDIFSFGIFNCGGLIEIAKYGISILVPDDTFEHEIQAGIMKSDNECVLSLTDDETLLSSIFVLKTDHESEPFARPVLFSMDHSALFGETDWEFSIYHKGFQQCFFERIDVTMNPKFYLQLTPNRCFVMAENDGFFALVGRPKTNGNLCPSVKQMKYAILLIDGEIRVYLIQNTKAAGEILNEYIQMTNGKIVKMPEIFELNYPKKDKLENSYLNLELNVTYNNLVINSDSTCRKIRLSEIWNASCDFIEIQIPFTLNDQTCKQLKNSINFKLLNENFKQMNRTNFDLKVSLELQDKLLFSYANLNTTINDLHTANCNQQEFYSSVSVNPLFIPLKVSMLIDEFFHRYLKVNTLKKNDWRLLASLLKCDRNIGYFSARENSFEIIVGLWLMINMTNSDDEESFSIEMFLKFINDMLEIRKKEKFEGKLKFTIIFIIKILEKSIKDQIEKKDISYV